MFHNPCRRSAACALVLSLVTSTALGKLSEQPVSRPAARYYLAIGFGAKEKGLRSQLMQDMREALAKELQTLPDVTLAIGDAAPTAQELARQGMQGFLIDGSVELMSKYGGQQVDCEMKTLVATWPGQSIKMLSRQGAEVSLGFAPAAAETGRRDCLTALAGAARQDIQQFLMLMGSSGR
jgi:hypothetical protein